MFIETLENRRLFSGAVANPYDLTSVPTSAVQTSAQLQHKAAPIIHTPLGQFQGKMKPAGPLGRFWVEHPVVNITCLADGRYQARIYGSTMDFTSGYMVLKGFQHKTKMTLIGNTMSYPGYEDVEVSSGITETLQITANRTWTKLAVKFTADAGMAGGYRKLVWNGVLTRLST